MAGLPAYIIGGAVLGGGMSLIVGTAADVWAPPPPVALLQEYIELSDARWSARLLTKDDTLICELKLVSSDLWLRYKDCEAKLSPGEPYIAQALWEYVTEGQTLTVMGEHEFIYTGAMTK